MPAVPYALATTRSFEPSCRALILLLTKITQLIVRLFSVNPAGLAASRNPTQQATAIGAGLPPKRSRSLRFICFVVLPAFAKTAFRIAVEQQNPAVAGLLFVDPERFELSSSHGTIYAFYMLSFRFIVGNGKAGCEPIPFSVVALSHRPVATPGQPAP